MLKKNYHEERIFIAGAKGMVGSSIKNTLTKKGYGNKNLEKTLLCPSKAELDLLNFYPQFNRKKEIYINPG